MAAGAVAAIAAYHASHTFEEASVYGIPPTPNDDPSWGLVAGVITLMVVVVVMVVYFG